MSRRPSFSSSIGTVLGRTSLDKPSALDKFREWCKNDETILDEGVVGGALDEIEALRKIEEGA